MPFMNLPTEIVFLIAESLDDNRELSMLARTCRFLYEVANPILYARNIKHEGSSALLWAGKTGMAETAMLCIKYGANLGAYTDDYRTPLIYAADNGHLKLAELLLACPSTCISACDIDGHSSTFLAARNDRPEVLELLLRHGADADQIHRDGMGMLHIPDLSFRAMRILLRYGANPGQMDSAGNTPLSRAVKSRSIPHVTLLLEWGAGNMIGPVDLQDDPLAVALERQDEDILRPLLRLGVQNSFALSLQGASIIHQAILLNKPRSLQVLLEEGVDPDQQSWGRTALHLAVQVKSLKMARILVEHGASSQLVDRQDGTPHHVAASNRQILILQLLLANDPDPVVREYFLMTPIDEYDSPEAEAVLLTKGEMGSRLAALLQIDPSAKRRRGPPLSVVFPKESRKKSTRAWCWT